MNQVLLDTTYTALTRYELASNRRRKFPVYHELDKFMGAWNADDLAKFKKNVTDFEKIDEELWR